MMHKSIPIWRDATTLLLEVEQVVLNFPRYHKYTLGSEVRQMAMRVCQLINAAFNDKENQKDASCKALKRQKITQLIMTVDDMKLQIQLAKELFNPE